MLAKIKSTILVLTTLVTLISADCFEQKYGFGDLPIPCTSYKAPPNVKGAIKKVDSHHFSIQFDAAAPGYWEYYFKNDANYDITFGVQYFDRTRNENVWDMWMINSRGECILHLPGHLETFKLTC